eukprot:Skav217504  [mRNA]  locus=scaffold1908:322142:327949:- [translate_table: standard]
MFVLKRDGTKQEVKFDAITQRIQPLCEGLDPNYIDPIPVTQKVIEGFYNGIATAEIDTLAAETCAYMSQKHPDFSILAARIAVSNLHKNTSDSFYETCKVLYEFTDEQGRAAALLAEDVWEFVKANAEQLDAAVDYKRDFGYDYFGFKTLEKSYLLRVNGKSVERPQHLIMRAACGIHCGDLAATLETYDLMSKKNIHMVDATTAKLSSMHFHGWELGLKTGLYYLRTKAAADAIKFTVDVNTLKRTASDSEGSTYTAISSQKSSVKSDASLEKSVIQSLKAQGPKYTCENCSS